jgi:hypothetical protein
MNPRPLRLRALDALTELISGISMANGFQFDLSGENQVVRGRIYVGDSEPLPMVSFIEPPLAIEPGRASPQNPNRNGEWDILVQGWVDDDPWHPCDKAYVLSAEVAMVLAREKKKPSGRPGSGLGPDFLGLGPIITDMRIGAPVVRPPDGTSTTACFYIVLTLQIVEDMTQPFS